MRLIVKSRFLSKYIQEWLQQNNKIETAPNEVIDYLVSKNMYKSYSLRSFHRDLRNLKNRNMLHHIEGIEIKQIKRYWILKKI